MTTKTLNFAIIISLLLIGCSPNETSDDLDSQLLIEEGVVQSKTSDLKATVNDNATNQNIANRIPLIRLSQLLYELSGPSDQIAFAIVDYAYSNINIKTNVRNDVGVSYFEISSTRDLFQYTVGESATVHNIIGSHHVTSGLLDSFNPTALEVCYDLSTTEAEKNIIRNDFRNNHGLEKTLSDLPNCDIWVFKECCIGSGVCDVISQDTTLSEGIVFHY